MPSFHSISYEYYPWSQLGDDIFALSKQIIESGQEFDRIIALAKGGLAFSRSLVDYLNVPEVSSIQIEFYSGINEASSAPVILQSLPISIKNERVLVFDDLADSGDSLKTAVNYLQHHGPQSIHTATLFVKPHSKFKPDFSVKETSAWVIFPNEVRETIAELSKMWQEKGDNHDTIKQQLIEIGFPEDQVDFFMRT